MAGDRINCMRIRRGSCPGAHRVGPPIDRPETEDRGGAKVDEGGGRTSGEGTRIAIELPDVILRPPGAAGVNVTAMSRPKACATA